ncbi:MAG: hypothetical protein NTV51_14680 [Verrucomicrobia bacterium]|nr:hypothetical protein [Verrucomicrobiota bacterium]
MITAPELSRDADPTQLEPSPGHPADAGPPPAIAPTRKVWWVSDLLLIALVGFLAVGATVTTVQHHRHTAAVDRFTKDLTFAAAAFQAYIKEKGVAPPDSDAGVIPPGMAPHLTQVDWTAPSAVGGAYRWVNIAAGEIVENAPISGTLALTAFPPSPPLALTQEDLLEIDRRIDDGNLTTGKFRTGFNGWPVLTVQVEFTAPAAPP